MASPDLSGRLTGRKASFLFGDASGGTQEYAGADGRKWEASITVETADVSGLDDIWNVGTYTTMGATFSVEKMVVTYDFLELVTSGKAPIGTFYRGGKASTGAQVLTGQVLFKTWSTSHERGAVVLENVSGEFTGEVTVASA